VIVGSRIAAMLLGIGFLLWLRLSRGSEIGRSGPASRERTG
jgi:hypothetical protein